MNQQDPAQFVKLLMRHQDALLRYILPQVGCLGDAEDVLQESATAIWKKFEQYDEQQPFLPWAKQFARNEILMHHRRAKRYTFLSDELIELLQEQQTQRENLKEQRQSALQACLKKLPEADQQLIQSRYSTHETTLQQIADESGQTMNVLYKALGRIRKQLLDCIEYTLESGVLDKESPATEGS